MTYMASTTIAMDESALSESTGRNYSSKFNVGALNGHFCIRGMSVWEWPACLSKPAFAVEAEPY
jgi:hypothetical protein